MARRRRALELNEGSLLRCCAEELHSSQTFATSRQKDHSSQRIYRRTSVCTQSPQSDRKSTPLNSSPNAPIVCRILIAKKRTQNTPHTNHHTKHAYSLRLRSSNTQN